LEENVVGISERKGIAARRWAQGMVEAAERMLLASGEQKT
jgi:hypothetical protein